MLVVSPEDGKRRAAIDQPTAVRPGEELDVTALAAYLRSELRLDAADLEIAQFPSGYSNLTYLLRVAGREIVLRRPPFGSTVKSAHDMGREHRILSALAGGYGKVPRPLAYCDDQAVIGAPFYLMERVRGVILRSSTVARTRPEPAVMRSIAGAFLDTLVELHAVNCEEVGLGDLGRPEGYVRRQVEGWSQRWTRARTDEVPEMDVAARWLADRQPPEADVALIHNDFKYDNLVLDLAAEPRVAAVLDWEMATLGDPLMDLGTSLGYWVEAGDPIAMRQLALSPTTLDGNPGRLEIAQRYAAASGRPVGERDLVFYYVFGLF